MTIKELRKKLEELETLGLGNVPVEIENSYWRSEGYGKMADDYATSPILSMIFRDGKMCLEANELREEE